MERVLSYGYLYLIPLTIGSVYSLRSFRWHWIRPLRIFSALLSFTLATEVVAILWKWELSTTSLWSFSSNNLWIYNAGIVIRHLFMLAFFHGIFHSNYNKRFVLWSILPFLLLSIVNYFFLQSPNQLNTYTLVVGNSFIVVLVLVYFNQVLQDRIIIELHRHPVIWIALGTLLYYSATLPLFIFFNYLAIRNEPLLLSYLNINDTLNVVMYFFYLIAFLCKAPLRT